MTEILTSGICSFSTVLLVDMIVETLAVISGAVPGIGFKEAGKIKLVGEI